MNTKLYRFTSFPEDFFTISPRDLHTILPGPSLFEIPGEDKAPLFISTLLHGNETTGFIALQKVLKKYILDGQPLPRPLMIFIGNVHAAKEYLRHLPSQKDYNRIWSGGESSEHHMAKQVLEIAKAREPFASLDIHNNTGSNPLYGCVNKIDNRSLHLAKMFSEKIVYFIRPSEVQSLAFNQFCTAVTLECGQSGERAGIERATAYIQSCIDIEDLSDDDLDESEISVFHSVARIKIPTQSTIGFGQSANADLAFVDNFETLNFIELAEHTCIGWQKNPRYKLIVIDEQGYDVSNDFFTYIDGEIRTTRPIIPSMFCKTEKIIRQDCLGYIMQRYCLR